MNDVWHNLHFLRPAWLLALPLLWWLLYRARAAWGGNPWARVVDAQLLPHLLERGAARGRAPLWLAGVGASLAVLALAGPAWRQLPQPVYDAPLHRVLVLDLSAEMNAADLKPNRLQRARLIAHQLLRQQAEGETALVAFAGSAFPVVPLTRDDGTIRHLLDSLDTSLMPVPGQNLAAGIDTAVDLLRNAKAQRGDIVLLSAGAVDAAARQAAENARADGYRVHVLGAGTGDGAPVPNAGGGWRRDRGGGIELARIDEAALRELAAAGGGRYARIDRIDADWSLHASLDWAAAPQRAREDFQADLWQDEGPWLLLPLLGIAALGFRRGWLMLLLIGLPLAVPGPARAELWRNADQAGHALLQQGEAAAAADTFRSPDWRASALYQAGDYAAAAELWAQGDGARAAYNRGNALARAGQLDQALKAYDEALAREPGMPDAQANRQLIEQLLEQQEQQQQDSEQAQDGEPGQQPQSGQDGEQQPGEDGQPQESQSSGQQQDDTGESTDARQQAAEPSEAQEPGEAQAAQPAENAETPSDDAWAQQSQASEEALSAEQAQAVQQWLNRLEDDPGRLLREKFKRMQQRRNQER